MQRKLILIILFITTVAHAQKVVYLKPPSGFENEKFFDLSNPLNGPDLRFKPIIDIKRALVKKGFQVKIMNFKSKLSPAEAVILFNTFPTDAVGQNIRKNAKKVIFVLTEPPSAIPASYQPASHKFFDAVLTMVDTMVDNKKYFKFHYPFPGFQQTKRVIPFSKKHLCNIIATNRSSSHPHQLYTARVNAIRYFEKFHPGELDLYGNRWQNFNFKSYKGPVIQKAKVMPHYKFAICYENTRAVHGYITEKIFDCFVNRCVPVYWGAPNIDNYVPKQCYIDRRTFATNDQLYAFLTKMTEAAYNKYQQAITSFLATEKARKFSSDNFVEAIIRHVSEPKKVIGCQSCRGPKKRQPRP
jgi:hypothetical protein